MGFTMPVGPGGRVAPCASPDLLRYDDVRRMDARAAARVPWQMVSRRTGFARRTPEEPENLESWAILFPRARASAA